MRHVYNLRDLGGRKSTSSANPPSCNVRKLIMFRSSASTYVDAEDTNFLSKEMKVSTIIDLRTKLDSNASLDQVYQPLLLTKDMLHDFLSTIQSSDLDRSKLQAMVNASQTSTSKASDDTMSTTTVDDAVLPKPPVFVADSLEPIAAVIAAEAPKPKSMSSTLAANPIFAPRNVRLVVPIVSAAVTVAFAVHFLQAWPHTFFVLAPVSLFSIFMNWICRLLGLKDLDVVEPATHKREILQELKETDKSASFVASSSSSSSLSKEPAGHLPFKPPHADASQGMAAKLPPNVVDALAAWRSWAFYQVRIQFMKSMGGAGGMYTLFCENAGRRFGAVLRLITTRLYFMPKGSAVLFHCQSGKDRTGIVAMLIYYVLQVDKKSILDDYTISHDFGSTEEHRIVLGIPRCLWPTQEEFQQNPMLAEYYGSPRYALESLIDHLEAKYGSIEAYLDSIGFDEGWRNKLRAILYEAK
eukprot:CAMPEP_0184698310 /NCGR_PEP_ID=MMETSP0313-20130426/4977_1 /TAXON_ID=2792 /ORGANISM="Porphyridium aerugineum, Strain SAG 1380-2" /LENGTH=468 /DNA_ID=CAMNT_0027157231 /DNA_START=45 /DNA_END=1451 /DNA_ORIENTATION=+